VEYQPKAIVKKVCAGSIAEEAGIKPGDIIHKINGRVIHDILEYKFLISDEWLEIEVIKPNGEVEIVSVYNEEYEDLGIDFENPLIDRTRSCSNKCIFCFIDQLPKGMRKTLYFKDDDTRLSFFQGNYVTLTNMSEEDIRRILYMRISPINISVHTTNPELRVKMLGNKKAVNILSAMKKFAQAKIMMNCQIVLCRDINDGNELNRTIQDLSEMYPCVNSISVVPVGLTNFRDKLFKLEPFDSVSSKQVVAQVEKWQNVLLDKYGSRIVYLADEFYLMAQKPIPPYEEYEDFPQIENGVGLIASMKHEFEQGIRELMNIQSTIWVPDRVISIATGTAAYSFINELVNRLELMFSELHVNVYAVKNNFFGENVTVAGLITATDMIRQLTSKEHGSELLIPVTMLRKDGDVFLDDISISELERILHVKVVPVENNGFDFIRKILGQKIETFGGI